jgi:hypothetical protein
MSATPTIANLTPEILRLENIAASATGSEKATALSKIDKITREAVDSGTVSYGLRVLSRFGYDEKTLREIANQYNSNGQWLGQQLGHPYDRNPPHLHFFHVVEGYSYRKIDLGYQHSPSQPEN